MLFPIGDEDRQHARTAYVTVGLILINLFVFFVLQGAGSNDAFIYGWSVIPQELMANVDLTQPQQVAVGNRQVEVPQAPGPRPIYLTILSAMFMHGGYAHLFGNVLYLWIFSDNVEDRIGPIPFLGFYLLCGLVATVAQVALDPQGVIPNLGASGAISGVLGAYLVFFPRNRVHALFFYVIVSVPAFLAIGLWIVFQFFNGIGSIMAAGATLGGVAYGAHIGGFLAGISVAAVLRMMTDNTPSKEGRGKIYARYDADSPRRSR